MQTWLSVEQCDVTVNDMPFDYVAYPQPICNRGPVTKLQILLEPIAAGRYIVRSRMYIATIANRLLQPLDVVCGYALRIRKDFRDTLGDSDLINAQVGIG